MNNFLKRTITGSLFVGITTSLILVNVWTFLAFTLSLVGLLIYEFLRITKSKEIKPNFFISILVGLCSVVLVFFGLRHEFEAYYYGLLLIPIFLLFIQELFSKNKNPIRNISISVLSLVYIVVPMIISILLVTGSSFSYQNQTDAFYPEILMGILILIWTFESMAYSVGVPLGRHRLFERISPKKSWEGTIGGAVFTLAAGYFLCLLFPVISQIDWLIISILVVIFGTIGDLIESMFKRQANIKDSSNLIPGHGGFLDRFDSVIFAAPFIFIYLYFI
ncbi:MAG: phosphatidate cytidylyltransferase [Flavobacteriaceae bacterium]|nr:phosphatidate cytidylyltransferase [Flavobacteriaceae bacterium]